MKNKKKINYAVIGLGHIAQVAILPAFRNAKNSKLTALVSGDPKKLKTLGKRYGVKKQFSYDQIEECLRDPELDAVYIALPNHLHKKYALMCAEAEKHILCEKPIAVTQMDAKEIVMAAQKNDVKLMTAYRLHFDPSNLRAIDVIQSGKIGEPLFFTSEFGHQIKEDNIRAEAKEGGSPLHDLGIYCINASRYIMRAEPIEVFAMAASPAKKLPEIEQTVTATLKFPDERLATFICSFASAGVSNFRVVGSKGDLFIENVYEYTGESFHTLTVNDKKRSWTSKAGDQFAAELIYFSNCILRNRPVETSGTEGVVDVQIIEALLKSIKTGKAVRLVTDKIQRRPTLRQGMKKPAHRKPQLVHAESESRP